MAKNEKRLEFYRTKAGVAAFICNSLHRKVMKTKKKGSDGKYDISANYIAEAYIASRWKPPNAGIAYVLVCTVLTMRDSIVRKHLKNRGYEWQLSSIRGEDKPLKFDERMHELGLKERSTYYKLRCFHNDDLANMRTDTLKAQEDTLVDKLVEMWGPADLMGVAANDGVLPDEWTRVPSNTDAIHRIPKRKFALIT